MAVLINLYSKKQKSVIKLLNLQNDCKSMNYQAVGYTRRGKELSGVLQRSDIDNENIVADGLPVSIFFPAFRGLVA